MLGGFSACTYLRDCIRETLGIPVITFPDPSLAIVKGASFYTKYDLKKTVANGWGLEVSANIN